VIEVALLRRAFEALTTKEIKTFVVTGDISGLEKAVIAAETKGPKGAPPQAALTMLRTLREAGLCQLDEKSFNRVHKSLHAMVQAHDKLGLSLDVRETALKLIAAERR
jgi:hypothetical protein